MYRKNLDLQLEIARRSEGAGAVFNVTFNNPKSLAPCYVDAGYSNVKIQVTSGDENIWNSQVCKAGAQSKTLLLGPGVSSRQGYLWNGIHAGSDCTGTALAQAGTYRVSLSVNEKTVVENLPFIINQNRTISIPAAPAQPESAQ
ncbi:hypothetical protein RQN30_09770 [Arcanobacterium hippocoleae]